MKKILRYFCYVMAFFTVFAVVMKSVPFYYITEAPAFLVWGYMLSDNLKIKNSIKILISIIPILTIGVVAEIFEPSNAEYKSIEEKTLTDHGLGSMLPSLEKGTLDIQADNENWFYAIVDVSVDEYYDEYVDDVQKKGFTIDGKFTEPLNDHYCYQAFNERGYRVQLVPYDDNFSIDISYIEK